MVIDKESKKLFFKFVMIKSYYLIMFEICCEFVYGKFRGEADNMDVDVGVGVFSKVVKVKVFEENVCDMFVILMFVDD